MTCYNVYYAMGVDLSVIKNPCLSLGARGTIGESLTFTKRRGVDIAEKKPVLPYSRTLPLQYQRWLWRDYAYLWTQQSEATRREYAAAGSRHHLTSFQSWMKYQLTNLPDLSLYLKLDEREGAVTHDSSRNLNHGTVVGASVAAGVIDVARYFDGLNDHITTPMAGFDYTRGTFECFLTADNWADNVYRNVFGGQVGATYLEMMKSKIGRNLFLVLQGVGIIIIIAPPGLFVDGTLYHVAATWDFDTDVYSGYVDGVLCVTSVLPFVSPTTPATFYLGSRHNNTQWWQGILDQATVWKRALDVNQILEHAERRWPR